MAGRTPDDLRMLVLAGANLSISATNLTELELRYIVVTAAQSKHKPKITLRDVNHLSTDQLRRLATAGQGAVVFDDLVIDPSEEPMAAPVHPFAR